MSTHTIIKFTSDEWEGYNQLVELMCNGYPHDVVPALLRGCKKYLKRDFTDWDPVITMEVLVHLYTKESWGNEIGIGTQDNGDYSEYTVTFTYQPDTDEVYDYIDGRMILITIAKDTLEAYEGKYTDDDTYHDFRISKHTVMCKVVKKHRKSFETLLKAELGEDTKFAYV